MKAVVFHGVGDIRLDDVPEPKIQQPTDALVRVTASAICGTDLHFIRGTVGGMKPGTILGHEAIGIVEEVGADVRNVRKGDRVVVPSTIACGYCSYCRAGYTSQCDVANPNGPLAGTCFFGGPESTGSVNGLQAEFARVPFATGLVKLPADVDDDKGVLLSDIFPTGYFGTDLAEIEAGDTVAVFGCGPVGQFAIASARLHNAGRIFAVDCIASRLEMAQRQGAEPVDFNQEDPVEALRRLTGGIGPDRTIDAVGVDANAPASGPAARQAEGQKQQAQQELRSIAPQARADAQEWRAGNSPSQALDWAVQAVAKAGTVAIIGVYPPTDRFFPIGQAMNKNLTVKSGNCPHRAYLPRLVDYVESGVIDPSMILTQTAPLVDAIEAYKHLDRRDSGWVKVELKPAAQRKAA